MDVLILMFIKSKNLSMLDEQIGDGVQQMAFNPFDPQDNAAQGACFEDNDFQVVAQIITLRVGIP